MGGGDAFSTTDQTWPFLFDLFNVWEVGGTKTLAIPKQLKLFMAFQQYKSCIFMEVYKRMTRLFKVKWNNKPETNCYAVEVISLYII